MNDKLTRGETETFERLIGRVIDDSLSADDTVELNRLLVSSPAAVRLYEKMLDQHAALCELYPGSVYLDGLGDAVDTHVASAGDSTVGNVEPTRRTWSKFFQLAAVAASSLAAVGLFGVYTGPEQREDVASITEPSESLFSGHAVLTRSVGVEWTDSKSEFREGDVLPAGTLMFDAGLAEIDLFCGATLVVEGPASLELESDWVVKVHRGRLRANVPPAARGFVVKAADSEVIDLGTEFALEVGPNDSRLEVIDGEVKLRGGPHDGEHLLTGESKLLSASGEGNTAIAKLTSNAEVKLRRATLQQEKFREWLATSKELRNDERLIAYYPIAGSEPGRVVPDAAHDGNEQDGRLIGLIDRVEGRFGEFSDGLEFERTGARVRVRIDGEFEAYTFACWVRIDALNHRYNALFMGDGYENGEPHWQIRDDGRLMFSVMVDDSQLIEHFNKTDNKVVRDAGLHRVYMTEPIWDVSKSGQWFHLAAVFDPAARVVTQYVNGDAVSEQEIEDKFFIDILRIGPAEIGNWGQPFRKSPWFAVRNLNGVIDELAIYNAALTTGEIETLYEEGKPLGY